MNKNHKDFDSIAAVCKLKNSFSGSIQSNNRIYLQNLLFIYLSLNGLVFPTSNGLTIILSVK